MIREIKQNGLIFVKLGHSIINFFIRMQNNLLVEQKAAKVYLKI